MKKKSKKDKLKEPDKGQIILPEIRFETATAKKDVRYYLNEPYLDLRGKTPVLVATNGHFLIAVECEIEGQVSQGSISLEAITRCRKDGGKHTAAVLKFDGKMHGTGKVMFERPNLDGVNYPKWEQVAPKIEQRQKADVAFNAEYIATLARALDNSSAKSRSSGMPITACGLILGKDKKAKTKVKPVDPRAAISVRGNSPACFSSVYHAVLMPLRLD